MRTTYTYSDFKETYALVAENVEEAMKYGVMHYVHLLNESKTVPTEVISSIDLVAVEWNPQHVPTLTLTIAVYLTNDMFFVDSINIQHGDVCNKLYDSLSRHRNVNYPIDFYQAHQQEELPMIVENRLRYNAGLLANNVRHHTLLSFTKNTQYFHDVYTVNEDTIQNYNYLSFIFDPKLDRD